MKLNICFVFPVLFFVSSGEEGVIQKESGGPASTCMGVERRLQDLEKILLEIKRRQDDTRNGNKEDFDEVFDDLSDFKSDLEQANALLAVIKQDTSLIRQNDKANRVSPLPTESPAAASVKHMTSIPFQKLNGKLNFVLRNSIHTLKNVTKLVDDVKRISALYEKLPSRRELVFGLGNIEKLLRDQLMSQQLRGPSRLASLKGPMGLPLATAAYEFPRQCMDIIRDSEDARSGVYRIKPVSAILPFFVYCDMDTDGGGWTVFQRREHEGLSFDRPWNDYRNGFGNIGGVNSWLGLEKLFHLTNQEVMELRIDLTAAENETAFVVYKGFAIGGYEEGYKIRLLGEATPDSTAGDSLTFHSGEAEFVTKDVTSDTHWDDCARQEHAGGWWFKSCDLSNLNGLYLSGQLPFQKQYQGIYWHHFKGSQYSLLRTKMMVRPLVKEVK